MKAIQYTIRNIPAPVDRYLRRRAQISGQSLNQVIVQELSEKAGLKKASLADSLDWFIGSGIDQATLDALDTEDRIQKSLAAKELDR